MSNRPHDFPGEEGSPGEPIIRFAAHKCNNETPFSKETLLYIRTLMQHMWYVEEGIKYSLNIAIKPEERGFIIEIFDEGEILFVPGPDSVGWSTKEAVDQFVFRLKSLDKCGWAAPPKLDEYKWRNSSAYMEVILAGKCHPKNELVQNVDVFMHPLDIRNRQNDTMIEGWQAVLDTKCTRARPGKRLEISGRANTKDEALMALYQDVRLEDPIPGPQPYVSHR